MTKAIKSKTPNNEKDFAQTPLWFMRSLESFMGAKFDLDVCANKATAKAKKYYSLQENGQDSLLLPWSKRNWCNPPFTNIKPFILKTEQEAQERGAITAIIMPNSPENAYIRELKRVSDLFVEMPFRLKFKRPDGTPFVSEKTGLEQSPQFSCAVGIVTPWGLHAPCRSIYHDFRTGFYKPGAK